MTNLVQYVQAGACVRSGGAPGVFGMVVGCSLEREDCEGTVFRSSRELNLAGSETVGFLCLGFAFDTPVGRCKYDHNYVCTSNSESCANEDGFEPISDYCTVLVDTSPQRNHNRSYFGGCASTAFPFSSKCYWSKVDCDTEGSDTMQWISAGSNSECTCEETRTGACESNGEYYCAVSEFGCDEESTFVPAAQLPANVTCFLCDTHQLSIIEMFAKIDEPEPPTPQLASQNQSASQDKFPTESQEGEPTSSTEQPVPTALPTNETRASSARVQPHFEKDNDTVALYVGIPTILLFTLLIFCAITCTGSSKIPKQLGGKSSSKEDDDGWVASVEDEGLGSPRGELA